MLEKWCPGRTIVCIVAGNIYHSQKELGWPLDLKKLWHWLHQEMHVFRVYYYTAYDPNNYGQKKFLDFLDIIGYCIRKKPIKFIKDPEKIQGGFHKGNLDVELTIDALHNSQDYDSFLLLSGDGDFAALLQYLKGRHKNCVVISSSNHIAFELAREAKLINLKKLRLFLEKQIPPH